MKQIAPLCPSQYGGGVFVARAILSGVDSTLYYSDCGPEKKDDDHRPNKMENNKNINIPPSPSVYPNPANTQLNVELNLSKGVIAHICLYNSLGQLVQCVELQGNLTTLPISTLASGIYYYRILDEKGNVIRADKQMIVH